MCLDNLWPKEKREKWLLQQNEYITAYKVVKVQYCGHIEYAVPPICYRGFLSHYEKTNKIPL
jgi:hypothetical protein